MFFSRKNKKKIKALLELQNWESGDVISISSEDSGYSDIKDFKFLVDDGETIYLHSDKEGETYKTTTISVLEVLNKNVTNLNLKRKRSRADLKATIEILTGLKDRARSDSKDTYLEHWLERYLNAQ